MTIQAAMGKVIFSNNHPGQARRMRRKEPITRSYWSARGQDSPRSLPSLRFKKLFARSPRSAPVASSITERTVCRGSAVRPNEDRTEISIRPTSTPQSTPPKNPRYVLPSPKILLPSLHSLPRSMGVPPPRAAAAEFGTYAGIMIHSAASREKIQCPMTVFSGVNIQYNQ